MELVLLQFNNYANRILKKYDNIQDYYENARKYFIVYNYDFNPGDNVDTELTIGGDQYDFNGDFDYLVLNDGANIVSRWFIMDSLRICRGQYKVTIHRDVLADFFELLRSSKAFIEKGWLNPGDPAIFNSENMGFNQIKTEEFSVRDYQGIPWIIGYYDRSQNPSGTGIGSDYLVDINKSDTALTDWEYYQYISNNFVGEIVGFYGKVSYSAILGTKRSSYFNSIKATDGTLSVGTNDCITIPNYNKWKEYSNNHYVNNISDFINATQQDSGYNTTSQINAFKELNGKTITFSNNKYYKITTSYNTLVTQQNYSSVSSGSHLDTSLRAKTTDGATINGNPFEYRVSYNGYKLTLEEIPAPGVTFNYSIDSNRAHCSDAPYDIFAIPFGNILYGDLQSQVVDKKVSYMVAMDIAKTAGVVYDLQLLPYAPNPASEWNPNSPFDSKYFDYIYDSNDNKAGIIFHVTDSSFTRKAQLSLNIIPVATDSLAKKLQNECDLYRLCSPNYNGVFEFSPAKFESTIKYFNVSATYKPFQPYIKVAPEFSGMYGKDFKDNRGLILGGDFSLPVVNDQWKTYEINNKNYNNIFNRQIDNLNFNNSEQLRMAKWNVLTGTIQGAGYGAMAGSSAGGSIGAGIGAGVGALAGLAGGIADVELMKRTQAENLDYKHDLFGYELGNIKARPDTLSKTSAYCIDNKYFPFIEKYTCTDTERQALQDKITYNGMTIMRIGTIDDFNLVEGNYVKGQFLRLDDFDFDFHEANAIRDEFNMGVYIYV